MPWIRAISGRLDQIAQPGPSRSLDIAMENLLTEIPAVMNSASMKMEVDLIRREEVIEHRDKSTWEYVWGKVGVRIRTGYVAPQIATLSWFHSS
jgi:hypothetical protein